MLVSGAEVIAWAAPGMTGYDSTTLDACIAAAQSDVQQLTGLYLEPDTLVGERFNGSDAGGRYRDVLVLSRSPVKLSLPTFPLEVTEDGTALVVGTFTFTGQSPALEVIARNVNSFTPAAPIYLYRVGRCWSPGRQNITVNYYTGAFDAGEVPAGLKQCIVELAWLYFKAGRTIGATSSSSPSKGATNPGAIPPSIITRLSAWRAHR